MPSVVVMTTRHDLSTDPRSLATTYFQSWQQHDAETLRSVLAEDVTFAGVFGTATGIEECLQGLRGMTRWMTGIDIVQMVVEGPDVMTWYDLRTSVAPPTPTVNWSRVEDGRIVAIRAVFDPREQLAGMSAAS